MTLRKSTNLALAMLSAVPVLLAGNNPEVSQVSAAQALVNYGKLPLRFEENRGQADAGVKFLSRGNGYAIGLSPATVFVNLSGAGKSGAQSSIRVNFPGANPAPEMTGAERQTGVSSYFMGNDPAKWVSGAANFGRVRYTGLYPGVDLSFYGNQGQLEYDFIVAPGADPKSIRLHFDGARAMRVERSGDLVLSTANGEIRQHKPVVYQEGTRGRQIIEGRYVMRADSQVAFEIGAYDSHKALVIDPTLTFGTYLGSPGEEVFQLSAAASQSTYPAVAVDFSGNVYITGFNGGSLTTFTGHPKELSGSTGGGGSEVFVVKMNSTGTAFLYSVVFGGQFTDVADAIAVDSAGNAYVTGYTNSSNFPITAGTPQTTLNGAYNAFITKVNATGTAITYSTYLGGGGSFYGRGIAVDPSGNAYVTGAASFTGGAAFPVVNPISSTPSAGFLTEVNSAGTSFVYSTYLTPGIGYGIAVDSSGNAYVTGSTGTQTTPTPAQAYVVKVYAEGTGFAYGPVNLGNSGASLQTIGFGIALDSQRDVFVTGMTNDPSFPQISSGAAQSTYGGGLDDGFAVKLNPTGSLVFGTYIGGIGSSFLPERGSGIGVDLEGNAYVSGTTECIKFPTANSISGVLNGGPAVLMKGTVSGSSSNWIPTSLSGSFDQVNALAFDPAGNLYAGASAVDATGGGVYKLTSGSTIWAPTGALPNTSTVDAIAVDPNSTATIYAAGNEHLYQSTNGGGSWTQLSQAVGTGAVIAIAKTSPSTIYVGSSVGLIYSTNAGSTWSNPVAPPSGAITTLVVDPNNTRTAYAGTPNSVYQTVNGGANWALANAGLPSGLGGVVTGMAINGATQTIYVATPNGLYDSTNAGISWTQIPIGEDAATPQLVAVDSGNNVYVAFAGAGLATGTNGGSGGWSPITYNGLTQNQILTLAVPPGVSGTAYAGIVSETMAFLTKISPTGQSFLSSSCIGGSDNNLGQSIAVTPGGAVVAAGLTAATNFPATPGAVQAANAGLYDAFAIGIAGATGSSGPPTVAVQSPVNGAIVSGTVTVTGYALDTFSSGATTIATVQVWLDGVFAANATYGVSDPTACTPFPSAPGCPNVGFTYTFQTASLSNGVHTLDFYALDSNSPANIGSASFQFTVGTLPKPPYTFGTGPGPDVIWEEPTIGWAQVWYLNCPPCAPPVSAANLTQANPWNIVGIGDFNQDGNPDVVWQDPVSGAVQVWYLGGTKGVTFMSAANITTKNPWRVASIADFNQDGHPDLLWSDPTSGFAQIWFLGGPEGTTFLGAVNLTLTNPWRIVGTGDFNNDGFPDVLWQNPANGVVQIWYMGGTAPGKQGSVFQYAVNLTGPMTTNVVAIADFNNDGHQDVIFQDPNTGAATVYYYTGANGTTPNGTSVLSTGNPWYIAGPH